jgi:UDP-3-O-acyl N-acetylglucosamine deacetylase
MPPRWQNTISRPVSVSGIGFFTGCDVTVRFLPAEPNTGIRFRRVDLPGRPEIPATIDHALPRERRTAIGLGDASVELTEHVMAALAGFRVDNCVVEIDAPEPPGCDGSSLEFCNALARGDMIPQPVRRQCVSIRETLTLRGDDGRQSITVRPNPGGLRIAYLLDYGQASPIPPQYCVCDITPELFYDDLAYCRTFVLESEVASLRASGYGRRVTARDVLIFGPRGVVDNVLRADDECARHKILDCVGDLALLGCDFEGLVECHRSGHRLNGEMVRAIRKAVESVEAVETLEAAKAVEAAKRGLEESRAA